MEKTSAIAALAALAQESRLDIFRLLVQAGGSGLAAGQIAERLGLPSATLSFHLNQLRQAGLIRFRREGRSLIYAVEFAVMNDLMAYLTENCCGGNPAACGVGFPTPTKQGAGRRMIGTDGTTMDVIIYHNPGCGTSRNTLGLIRNAGIEPQVIEYLKTPPSRDMLASLIERMGVPVRSVLREKGTPFHELGLGNPDLTDEQLLDAMVAHPILINRPIVVTPRGVRLCRPSETVLDILPTPQRGEFRKEDGELVVGADGQRPESKAGTAGQ